MLWPPARNKKKSPSGVHRPQHCPGGPFHFGSPLVLAFRVWLSPTYADSNSDKNGQFKTNLHAGMYNLFVCAMDFVPQAQILDLRYCKPAELNVTLAINSEHSENDDN